MLSIDGIQALLQFILAIASLIIVHELGHFAAARLSGIEVEEFGIGFPPRIVTLFEAGGTKFSLNWIPLGGFVRPKGEDDPEVPSGLAAAPPLKRLFVLISGPAMNFIAGILLFSIVIFQIGERVPDQIVITEVVPGSPAEQADFQPGDMIIAANGIKPASMDELKQIIDANRGKPIEISLSRVDEEYTSTVIPRISPPPNEGALGIGMTIPYTQPVSAGRAVTLGVQTVGNMIKSIATLPGRLLGYKGMYDLYSYYRGIDSQAPDEVPAGTLSFFASISVSLAVLNLLPFPAFDGGRILFTLPELFFKKRLPIIYENVLNLLGLGFLLLVMIYVNLQDFINPLEIP